MRFHDTAYSEIILPRCPPDISTYIDLSGTAPANTALSARVGQRCNTRQYDWLFQADTQNPAGKDSVENNSKLQQQRPPVSVQSLLELPFSVLSDCDSFPDNRHGDCTARTR